MVISLVQKQCESSKQGAGVHVCAEAEWGLGMKCCIWGEKGSDSPTLVQVRSQGHGSLPPGSWSVVATARSMPTDRCHCMACTRSTASLRQRSGFEVALKCVWMVAFPYAVLVEPEGLLSSCCFRVPGIVFYTKVDFFCRVLFRCLTVTTSEVLVFALLPKCLEYFGFLEYPQVTWWIHSFFQHAWAHFSVLPLLTF